MNQISTTIVQLAALGLIFSAGHLVFGNKFTRKGFWTKVLIASLVIGGGVYFYS